MRSAVVCYAPEDNTTARDLGAYLEQNCAITLYYDEGLIRDGHDLVQATERAISADIAIVLLSPASVPRTWVRSRWEPVFLNQRDESGCHLACVLLEECRFPDLLRRKHFYNLAVGGAESKRALKRALLALDHSPHETVILPPADEAQSLDPEALAHLQSRLADRPGTEVVDADTALLFAHECASDYSGVFWIDCARRSRTGILGDTGQTLGLLLAGSPEQNRTDLIQFISGRRCLVIFHGMPPEDRSWFALGERCSVIFTPPVSERPMLTLDDTGALFTRWTTDPDACLRALADAEFHVHRLSQAGPETWEITLQLGTAAVSFLKHRERLAEAYEMLDVMVNACQAVGDVTSAYRLGWERSWILETWGKPASIPVPSYPPAQATQLVLQLE
ncbi:MAG TPA: toll/interleukin-1 receptor domain-containing protein [Bryobacteraceae bacterium]|nr:toll/interleukin-1 receptor domain-containing protein [Bryobacteraceae bacterium]